MIKDDIKLTLLSEGQIGGNYEDSQLEVIRKYGTKAAITDLCVLTGCDLYEDADYNIDEDSLLKGRTSRLLTRSDDNDSDVRAVNKFGDRFVACSYLCNDAVRPILESSVIFSQISPNRVSGYNGTEEVEYGEYPQYAPDSRMQRILERKFQRDNLRKTGGSYTFYSVKYNDYNTGFKPVTYEEYEYLGKKYIRIRANSDFHGNKFKLSNGVEYRDDVYVWLEVSPVKWLIDYRRELLISKKGLVSGIRFLDSNHNYKGDFSRTEIKKYLVKYMLRDLTQTATFTRAQDIIPEEKAQFKEEKKQNEKRRNPYGLKFGCVSEEEIIESAIESNIPVFLHGSSSEDKSSRIKQIDSTCEVIYLLNATLESLNGKSVYNQATGEMMDVKPSWFRKLEEKCGKEPDRLHIIFFDEITNAPRDIQRIVFNTILYREVNGIWKLPENARIVVSENNMKDRIVENEIAESLFNRFAHVYIKTTTDSWLKWASENNIHPAIYSYIAYKNGETLKSKYDEQPNIDPRKWEMASKMLYKTGSPEMLRALVGEGITREFVQFCNQQFITLDDVVNGNYTELDMQTLSTAERYATIMELSQVDNDNLEKVREFVLSLGAEFEEIFDALWTRSDESKLEDLTELKLAKKRS